MREGKGNEREKKRCPLATSALNISHADQGEDKKVTSSNNLLLQLTDSAVAWNLIWKPDAVVLDLNMIFIPTQNKTRNSKLFTTSFHHRHKGHTTKHVNIEHMRLLLIHIVNG
jgi:hypothetical protein